MPNIVGPETVELGQSMTDKPWDGSASLQTQSSPANKQCDVSEFRYDLRRISAQHNVQEEDFILP